jgi:phosphoglycerate dehydrogenase-like enzyme
MPWTIWCNGKFEDAVMRRLREGVGDHRLLLSTVRESSVLAGGTPDPEMAEADIAFGQPSVGDCLRYPRLRWVQLTTAGYARYDTDEFRENFRARGARLTKSSVVYAEPVAQHVMAMILALARNLLPSYRDQLTDHAWHFLEHRRTSRLLCGQTVLLLGYGTIGRRLAELLAPFRCEIYAVRRQTRSERGVRIVPEEDLTRVLALADHVVNLLPESETTRNWVNARRLACFRPGSRFYNVGRGTTVDQNALLAALQAGIPAAAYLDVTEPEPLPPDHPLWTAPNCFITPHTAGGRHDQNDALVDHFLANLAAFTEGRPLVDAVPG